MLEAVFVLMLIILVFLYFYFVCSFRAALGPVLSVFGPTSPD